MSSVVAHTGLAAHPAAADAPAADRQAQATLERDIKRNGLHQPIVMLDGQVLEGRRRHEACLAAGVLPEFRQYGEAADDRLDDPKGWARERCDRLLSVDEAETLRHAEAVIDQGLGVFVEVGRALQTVRDGRLYRQTHRTFEAWAEAKYELSRRHADRTIQAALVVQQIAGPNGPTAPRSEAVARELAALRDDPDAMRRAWIATLETHGDRPTAAETRAHVCALLPDPPAAPDRADRSTDTQSTDTPIASSTTKSTDPTPAREGQEPADPEPTRDTDGPEVAEVGEEHPDPWGRDRPELERPAADPATAKARAFVSLVRDATPADPRRVAEKLRATGDAAAIAYFTDLAAALVAP